MKHLIHILFFLTLGFTACQQRTAYPPAMQQAEKLMDTRPDSALHQLQGMADTLTMLPDEAQMYYHLLTIQAKDKQYITHTSDSLINRIVSFYEDYGDKERLMMAYFYQGSVYRDMNDAPRALKAFHQAINAGKNTENMILIGQTYGQMGSLLAKHKLYDEALEVYQVCLLFYQEVNERKRIPLVMRNIARMYDAKNANDSAVFFYEEAYQKALAWTKEHCKEGRDDNVEEVEFLGEKVRIKFTPEEKEKQWEFTVKMYCIIKDLMAGNPNLSDKFEEEKVGHNAIAGGFQGQRQWTDHWPNCDYPEALLSSTFDYEGAREPYTLATENDILNGMGMLMMRLLTHRAQIFADVRTYWSGEATERVTGYKLEGKAAESNGIIHLLNSGAACLDASGVCTDENGNAIMKKWWEVTDEDIKKMTDATVWCEAGFDNFRGGGFSSHYTTKAEMPCTMIRLNLVKGLGPVLQIAEGWTVNLPDEVSDTLMERTNPTWPCTWFAPRCDGKEGSAFKTAYEVMMNWGANHGAISYGHIGADLITMCSMLRIPVCMHNVPEDQIYRPACWNAFGMDKEGADYRACKNFGPLYATNR